MRDPWNGEILDTLPGLAGDIARLIDNKLDASRPHISIPAALSFVSALKAGRVECQEGTSPNLYCCVVAGSGTGKSRAQDVIRDLVVEANLESLLMGKPASDSGLLKALSTNPRQFLIWDEFGIALSELSKAAASHRALILSTLMELFSQAGKLFIGKEYSEQRRVDIASPFLSLFVASTPNRFFGALNQDFVEDGFLPRWLIFFPPAKLKPDKSAFEVPDDIAQRIVALDTPTVGGEGNIARILGVQKKFIPPVENQRMFQLDFKYQTERAKNEVQRIFWSRGFEQYLKLVMVLADGDAPTFEEGMFAFGMVKDIIASEIETCERSLYASERERTKERFRAMIEVGKTITLSQLTRKSWRLNLSKTERLALVDDLIDSGYWARKEEEGSGKKKQVLLEALE